MDKFITWALAIGAAVILLAGPAIDHYNHEHAPDNTAAKKAARQAFERDYRECMRLMGPDADLIRIEGTHDFACRKVELTTTTK